MVFILRKGGRFRFKKEADRLEERGRGVGRDGVSILTVENDKDERRRKSASASESRPGKAQNSKKKSSSGEVGSALRSVYQRTVNEDIPPDLLDLLGKLG